MAAHARPGGLVVIEPFIDPGEFRLGHISIEEGSDEGVRVSHSERTGNVMNLTMTHYVSASGSVSMVEPPRFDIAMLTADQFRDAMELAGLEVFHDPVGLMGRRLYIGRTASGRVG